MRRLALLLLTALSLVALTAATAAERPKVGMVMIGSGPNDPLADPVLTGLTRAWRQLPIEARAVAPPVAEGPFPSFRRFARERYDLVIGLSTFQIDVVQETALASPQLQFAILDVSWQQFDRRPRNVTGVVFREQEIGYVAGVLAGLMERRRPGRDVVGSVGGVKIPPVDRFIAGYEAGARSTGAKALHLYSDSFDYPVRRLCARATRELVSKGAGVVFQVAGGCGIGVLEESRRLGVSAIGVDIDQSDFGPHVLTSAMKRWDTAVYRVVEAFVQGRLRGGRDLVAGVGNGGLELAPYSPRVPPDVRRKVERVIRAIRAGKIIIPNAVS